MDYNWVRASPCNSTKFPRFSSVLYRIRRICDSIKLAQLFKYKRNKQFEKPQNGLLVGGQETKKTSVCLWATYSHLSVEHTIIRFTNARALSEGTKNAVAFTKDLSKSIFD